MLSGMARRECSANSTWEEAEYSGCNESKQTEALIQVYVIYTCIIFLSL